jgi:hypothetical protein
VSFEPDSAAGSNGTGESRATLPSDLGKLRALETDLEARWDKLREQGYGFSEVRARLREPGTQPEDQQRFLRSAGQAQGEFLSHLDRFSRLEHAYFMGQVLQELDRAVQTIEHFYGPTNIRAILRKARALKRLAAEYRELEPLYGTSQDYRRIAVYQKFYARVVAFSERIRGFDPTAPYAPPDSLIDWAYRIGRGLAWLASHFLSLVILTVTFFRILWVALSKPKAGSGTPFTQRVDKLFQTFGRIKGYEVSVEGEENIPREESDATVTVFAPAHRHGVTDNVTFSQLHLRDYLVFAAVDQLPLLPKFLKDRIASTQGLIPVGKDRGPSVDRALEAVAQGLSTNILVYPEGTVSEGFKGTRPPRKNFGEHLVRRIRASGRGLRLVPVTYLDNARFLDLPSLSKAPSERQRRVAVSRPLTTGMIDALLAAGGGEMVNRMVRLAWLENLVTDEQHLLGLDRVREVEKRLDRELDGIRYWGSTEPAPVSDTLETDSSTPIVVREEPFHRKRVRVFHLPRDAQDETGKIVLRNLEQDDSNELLIGVRAPAHIYLNMGNRRFDGDIFRPLSVREAAYVYPGIVIRFTGVAVKSINAMRRELERFIGREQRTLTCANSACKLIAKAANMKIEDRADMRPFLPSHVLPTRTIRKIIERGVRSRQGHPVEYQIYKSDARPLEAILREFRVAETRIAKDHLQVATVGAWRAFAAFSRRLIGLLSRFAALLFQLIGRAWARLRGWG